MRWLAPLLLLLPVVASADERRYAVGSFDRVRVEGDIEVEVTRAGSPSARAVGDGRALEAISVRVEGSTLVIGPNPSAWGGWPGEKPARPRVAVTVPAVRSAQVRGPGKLTINALSGPTVDASVSGPGSLSAADVRADEVRASLSGPGSLTLAGASKRASYRAFGGGTIEAAALQANEVTAISESTGAVRVNASASARVVAMSGPVEVTGGASCATRGPGQVACAGKIVKP